MAQSSDKILPNCTTNGLNNGLKPTKLFEENYDYAIVIDECNAKLDHLSRVLEMKHQSCRRSSSVGSIIVINAKGIGFDHA